MLKSFLFFYVSVALYCIKSAGFVSSPCFPSKHEFLDKVQLFSVGERVKKPNFYPIETINDISLEEFDNHTTLAEVDEVTVDVIVDNVCDLLGTIPNGFGTTEMNRINMLGKTFNPDEVCSGNHGLSLLIKARTADKTHTVLFDTGPSANIFLNNARKMNVNFQEIESIIISHYHYDHTGGLLAALEQSKESGVVVDLHPIRPYSRGSQKGSDISAHPFTSPKFEEIQKIGGVKLELHHEPHFIHDNFFLVSGEIPRNTAFEKGNPKHFSKLREFDEYKSDPLIVEERYVALKVRGRGLVVCSSCSHAGIINVLADVTKKTKSSKIAFVTGGFHLSGQGFDSQIEQTVQEMKKFNPELVAAGHCTGWRAQARFAAELNEGQFCPSAVGNSFKIIASCEQTDS